MVFNMASSGDSQNSQSWCTSHFGTRLGVCESCGKFGGNFAGSFRTTKERPKKIQDTGQKNPRVRKIRVRNSGAGNGCANFMDAWKNAFFLQENLCP